MKKTLALLLAAALCLSLAACGARQTAAKPDSTAGEVAGTTQTEETADPQTQTVTDETAPTEQFIELTLDNWQEYLEINQYLSVSYSQNAFGEKTGTSLYFFTLLEPKEAYSYYIADVAVEYSVDYRTSDITYDLDTFSYVLSDCVSHPDAVANENAFIRGATKHMPEFFPMSRDQIIDGKVKTNTIGYTGDDGYPPRFAILLDQQPIEQNEDGTGYLPLCPTNIQITRIEGTLEAGE